MFTFVSQVVAQYIIDAQRWCCKAMVVQSGCGPMRWRYKDVVVLLQVTINVRILNPGLAADFV